MGGIAAAIGLALTAAVFALLLQKDAPGVAFGLTLAAGILIFASAVQGIGSILRTLGSVMRAAGVENELYLPVVKAVGIAAAVRIAASLCRDAGQTSLAAKLELAGAVAALTVTLPFFARVLSFVSSMLT